MAPEFAFRSQRENAPFIPKPRVVHTAILRDPGYQPHVTEDRPSRVRAILETSPRAENPAMLEPPKQFHRVAWPCTDCGQPFEQKSTNHIRCTDCGIKHRRAADRARKTTAKTRRTAPRIRRVA